VVGQAEVRVVHPDRPAGLQRQERHPLAVARREVQLARDRGKQLGMWRRRALEDPDRPDVHVRDVVLHVQERRVERAQSRHGHHLHDARIA
jgi:hypothetical protein